LTITGLTVDGLSHELQVGVSCVYCEKKRKCMRKRKREREREKEREREREREAKISVLLVKVGKA